MGPALAADAFDTRPVVIRPRTARSRQVNRVGSGSKGGKAVHGVRAELCIGGVNGRVVRAVVTQRRGGGLLGPWFRTVTDSLNDCPGVRRVSRTDASTAKSVPASTSTGTKPNAMPNLDSKKTSNPQLRKAVRNVELPQLKCTVFLFTSRELKNGRMVT